MSESDSPVLPNLDTVSSLTELLDLSDAGGARTTEDIFVGSSHWMPYGRVFGGQIVAQSVVAASRSIDAPDRTIHSLHGYFLRPGDIHLPVTFSVDRIHDGRSFSTRRVQAYQNGVPIFSMITSFQKPDDGIEHQVDMPTGVPAPEALPSSIDLLRAAGGPLNQYWSQYRAIDIRHVTSPIFTSVLGERTSHQAVWFRSVEALPDDPALHRAVLAYASDYTILEPIMRKHGIAWMRPGLKSASLDHAIWFHRFARVDDWLLYDMESPTAQGGRGLSQARIFDREGTLIATVAQEGMVRLGAPLVPVA